MKAHSVALALAAAAVVLGGGLLLSRQARAAVKSPNTVPLGFKWSEPDGAYRRVNKAGVVELYA